MTLYDKISSHGAGIMTQETFQREVILIAIFNGTMQSLEHIDKNYYYRLHHGVLGCVEVVMTARPRRFA